ncbi:uncharacterized protein LOC124155116 [Ischnura elegans]|uniref:uncharacterized protein LOC124155116 n=1 Tax=Ischnura elegans TaxID=197161 RepID=UPI001ED8AFDE|nr:uncharacterized protein LOC124155116 [Ischnura elegans]
MGLRIIISLTIATLLVTGFSEGHPCTSRTKRSEAEEDAQTGTSDNQENIADQNIPQEHPSPTDNDVAEMETHDSGFSDDTPSDDGLLPSLGNKKQGEGGLFPSLPSFPSLGGGEGGGGGGGLVGPMAVIGGFTALVVPMGGPLMSSLPGAITSLMGMMPSPGSLPTIPGLGGGSSG